MMAVLFGGNPTNTFCGATCAGKSGGTPQPSATMLALYGSDVGRDEQSRGDAMCCPRERKTRGAKRPPKGGEDSPVSASLPRTTEGSIGTAGVSWSFV